MIIIQINKIKLLLRELTLIKVISIVQLEVLQELFTSNKELMHRSYKLKKKLKNIQRFYNRKRKNNKNRKNHKRNDNKILLIQLEMKLQREQQP